MPTPGFRTSSRSARTVGLVTSRPRSPGGLHVRGTAARVVRVMLLSGITAGALAAQQPAKWRLVEEWRVGGEVDGPHSFGDVRALAYLPMGGSSCLTRATSRCTTWTRRGSRCGPWGGRRRAW